MTRIYAASQQFILNLYQLRPPKTQTIFVFGTCFVLCLLIYIFSAFFVLCYVNIVWNYHPPRFLFDRECNYIDQSRGKRLSRVGSGQQRLLQ